MNKLCQFVFSGIFAWIFEVTYMGIMTTSSSLTSNVNNFQKAVSWQRRHSTSLSIILNRGLVKLTPTFFNMPQELYSLRTVFTKKTVHKVRESVTRWPHWFVASSYASPRRTTVKLNARMDTHAAPVLRKYAFMVRTLCMSNLLCGGGSG